MPEVHLPEGSRFCQADATNHHTGHGAIAVGASLAVLEVTTVGERNSDEGKGGNGINDKLDAEGPLGFCPVPVLLPLHALLSSLFTSLTLSLSGAMLSQRGVLGTGAIGQGSGVCQTQREKVSEADSSLKRRDPELFPNCLHPNQSAEPDPEGGKESSESGGRLGV